jgi:hypothetical protein
MCPILRVFLGNLTRRRARPRGTRTQNFDEHLFLLKKRVFGPSPGSETKGRKINSRAAFWFKLKFSKEASAKPQSHFARVPALVLHRRSTTLYIGGGSRFLPGAPRPGPAGRHLGNPGRLGTAVGSVRWQPAPGCLGCLVWAGAVLL